MSDSLTSSSSTAVDVQSEAAVDRLTMLLTRSRQAMGELGQCPPHQHSQALKAMGEAVLSAHAQILEANTLDLEVSREMAVPEQVTDWLKLTPERINRAARTLHRLGELGSPFVLWPERRRPVGLVALVHEAFPELAALAAGLCLRTGNGLVLKSSTEASQTNQAFVDALQEGLVTTSLPAAAVQLVPPAWSDVTRAMLVQQSALDLVIPHGRPKLVEQVTAHAAVTVVETYIGGCSLCVRPSADPNTVLRMLVDSYQGAPDAVNQITTVVLAGDFDPEGLSTWLSQLASQFSLVGSPALISGFDVPSQDGDKRGNDPLKLHQTPTLSAAIDWMNVHGNGRVMSLCSDRQTDVQQFLAGANGVELYINASSRFYRNPTNSVDIALGMSVQRGRVGLKTLTRPQRVTYGD